MKYKIYLFLFCFFLLFNACKSNLLVSEFGTKHPLTQLNGDYLSGDSRYSGSLAYTMMGGEFSPQPVNYVSFDFNGRDSLSVEFWGDTALVKKTVYKGKIVDNYFEFYFSKNKLLIPFVIININYRRARLGLTDDNQLLAHYWEDRTGGMFIFYDGQNYDYSRTYERINEWESGGLHSFQSAGKWGCKASDGRIVIAPEYDVVIAFDSQGLAKVKKEGKWALINRSGELITAFDYLFIEHYEEAMCGYKVTQTDNDNDRIYGYINPQGEVIVPIDFSDIYDTETKGVKQIFSGESRGRGFISSDYVICPPMLFSANSNFKYLNINGADPNMKYCEVIYGSREYYLSMDGYLYPFSSNIFGRHTKLKVEEREKVSSPFNLSDLKNSP